MYVETIFHEIVNGEEFLYWYSVRGEGGVSVDDSTHWIDLKHLEYWDECIDEHFGSVDLNTKVVMIPKQVLVSMDF